MCASHSSLTTSSFGSYEKSKRVWIWTKSKEVMTAAVERGWNTFVFSSQHRQLANEWSSIALISPLYIEEGGIFDGENRRVATILEVSNPQELQQLQPANGQAENVVINLLDWQVIPAENIVAAFQGCQKTVFAITKNNSEAQVFFEALEQGLGGVILKVEDTEAVFQLKVGSFARELFLVHSECLESNYIASRPFRVNAGPVHAYVAIPGGKTCYLSELKADKEVIVVDQKGQQRTAIVGRVKIETRPLILIEAREIQITKLSTASFYKMQKLLLLFVPAKGLDYEKQQTP